MALVIAGCNAIPETRQPQTISSQNSNASLERLQQEEPHGQNQKPSTEKQTDSEKSKAPVVQEPQRSDNPYLIATGFGDLAKGQLICQRVADTAARAELAKLIRVTIKEHATDRVREQTSGHVEQDVEVIREELVNEMLQDVKIVDRSVDRTARTCSSTAVMPDKRPMPRILKPSH